MVRKILVFSLTKKIIFKQRPEREDRTNAPSLNICAVMGKAGGTLSTNAL